MGKYTLNGVEYDNRYDWDDAVDRLISGKSYEEQLKEKQTAAKQFEELTTTGKVTTPSYIAETPLLNADTTPTASKAPKPFTESDEYKAYISSRDNALDALRSLGNFTFSKETEYGDAVKDYKGRDKFSYDINKDALYKQYAEKYMRQGQMAMMDTMGQAAMLSGGYGNSYAQSVGQQAYQSELQNLNDIVPQLYELAYDKYQQEGQDMLNAITLLEQERANEFSDYTTKYDKLLNEAEMYDQMATNQYDTDVKAWENDLSYSDLVNSAAEDKSWQYTLSEKATGDDGSDTYNDRSTGRTISVPKGYNPYTGDVNEDIKYGTFANGNSYQPDNVGGHKLVYIGIDDINANGDKRRIFAAPSQTGSKSSIAGEDGKLTVDEVLNNMKFYIWNDFANEYDEYQINEDPKAKEIFTEAITRNMDDFSKVWKEWNDAQKASK